MFHSGRLDYQVQTHNSLNSHSYKQWIYIYYRLFIQTSAAEQVAKSISDAACDWNRNVFLMFLIFSLTSHIIIKPKALALIHICVWGNKHQHIWSVIFAAFLSTNLLFNKGSDQFLSPCLILSLSVCICMLCQLLQEDGDPPVNESLSIENTLWASTVVASGKYVTAGLEVEGVTSCWSDDLSKQTQSVMRHSHISHFQL